MLKVETMSFLSRLLRRTFATSSHPSAAAGGPRTIREMAKDLYEERSPRRLAGKFKKYSMHEDFRKKTGVYEDVIRRLAEREQFGCIREILKDQKKYIDATKEGFNARLISLYGKSGMFADAQKVFDEMPQRNCERTVLSFNALLDSCISSRKKKYRKIGALFKELPQKLGIDPDIVSYNTMIKAYCQMGDFDSGVSLLNELEKKGLEPDLITFNTLLYGFYSNGLFEKGDKIWARMMDKNNVSPDVRSYNAKLLGLASEKRTKDAVQLVEEMKSKDIKPDAFSVSALIRGFVNENKLEEAKCWYNEMEDGHCKPTVEALIPFVCDKGDLAFAFQLSKDCFKWRFVVDEALLQHVVDLLVEEAKVNEAKELVSLGKGNGYYQYKLTFPV